MRLIDDDSLMVHINECKHRIDNIKNYINSNPDADTEECEKNISVLTNTINALEEYKKYRGGWIPVSERLPDEAFGCLVTVMDCEPSTYAEFENILPYFVGYDGRGWIDADGEEIPFEVIAWQPLPEAYKESED